MSSVLVTLCLVGGGAFLATFVVSTIQGILRSRTEAREDTNIEE